MAEILPLAARRGTIEQAFACEAHNTQMVVTVQYGIVPAGGRFGFTIEQKLPSGEWSMVGGVDVPDLPAALFNKRGNPITSLVWRFSEQVVANPGAWESERDVQIRGRTYRQLMFRPEQRITVTSNQMEYSIDVTTANVEPPAFQVSV